MLPVNNTKKKSRKFLEKNNNNVNLAWQSSSRFIPAQNCSSRPMLVFQMIIKKRKCKQEKEKSFAIQYKLNENKEKLNKKLFFN